MYIAYMCMMSSVAAIYRDIDCLYKCMTACIRVLPYLNISSLIGYELALITSLLNNFTNYMNN